MKRYSITVTLYEETEAEDEAEAFDEMMDLIENRDGMHVISHKIEEMEDGGTI